jgi:hypothetical protein
MHILKQLSGYILQWIFDECSTKKYNDKDHHRENIFKKIIILNSFFLILFLRQMLKRLLIFQAAPC